MGATAVAMKKIGASAFMARKKAEDSDDEDNGGILDQRRINEIFVRVKINEVIL